MGRKILYIITKSAWGGAQRYVYDLAAHLPAGRFDIAVACGGTGPLMDRLTAAGIRVIPVPPLERDIRIGRELAALYQLIGLIRRERPDIIHLSSPKAGGLGAVAGRLASLFTAHRPLVVATVHGWPFFDDRPRWQRAMIFLFSWLSAAFQNRIILIDTADYRSARRFIPERKLALIFHGIEPIDFLPRPAARAFLGERANTAIAPDTLLIGASAELTRNKGLTYLVAAARLLRANRPELNFKILIMGDGEERAALAGEISAAGLSARVCLAGFIPDAKRYLKGLDLFALPSVKEGLPYAIMEAMAAGLPIAASRVGGVPDLIRDGEDGLLVPPKDPTALAEAIGRLLGERSLALRLGGQARRAVGQSFSREAMIARTVALYGTS